MLPRVLAAAATLVAALAVSSTPALAFTTPFGNIPCVAAEGVRYCEGSSGPPSAPTATDTRVPSWEATPEVKLDVNVALPATGDGPWPLVMLPHGYGGAKSGLGTGTDNGLKAFASKGYAALSYSARGFGQSCGRLDSRLGDPAACARGWIHLDDMTKEIRDAQHLAGLLADNGVADPQKIGVTGPSYGGGVSLGMAVLKDRIAVRGGDGKLTTQPWTSPGGKPMKVAASAPSIPWSDLVSSLVPNGRTLDHLIDEPRTSREPAGVMKQSFVSLLYAAGNATGFYAPPMVDPTADITSWNADINAGEPYDANPRIATLSNEIATFHSPYHLPAVEPAPTFISNGFTDDLFPVDEAIRWVNRTKATFPGAQVAQTHFDYGHMRGQNKDADIARYRSQVQAWFAKHLKGEPAPAGVPSGVEVSTLTCGDGAPSGGPFDAGSWTALQKGEVRLRDPRGVGTVASSPGNSAVARAIDPIGGDGACAHPSQSPETGAAEWKLPKTAGDGFVLAGSPVVQADLTLSGGPTGILAGRLWDVAPDGEGTLVTRGLYRLSGSGRQTFQLHPGAWTFKAGHTARFQLLGSDSPYSRTSNTPFTVTVKDLDLRLPVVEKPDCTQVGATQGRFVPAGRRLAPGYSGKADDGCSVPLAPSAVAGVKGSQTGSASKTISASKARLRLIGRCTRRGLEMRVTGKGAGQIRHVRIAGGKADRKKPFTRTLERSRKRTVRAVVTTKRGQKVNLRKTVTCKKRAASSKKKASAKRG